MLMNKISMLKLAKFYTVECYAELQPELHLNYIQLSVASVVTCYCRITTSLF